MQRIYHLIVNQASPSPKAKEQTQISNSTLEKDLHHMKNRLNLALSNALKLKLLLNAINI